MTINSVDYTKQLASEREYFQDATRRLRDAADKRVEDINNRAEHVMKRQRDNFIEDRTELEKNFSENIENLNNQAKETKAKTNERFNERLAKEKEEFAKDSFQKSRDFDQRLRDIRSTFASAIDAEASRHEDVEKNTQKKFAKTVTAAQEASEKKIKEYQNQMTGAGADLKNQYNKERQQLVRAHDDRLTEIQKVESKKRAELRDKIDFHQKKQKEVHEAEMGQQKQYTNDRIKTMEKKFSDRYQTITKDYSRRSDEFVEEQHRQALKTNREHREQMDEFRRDYNDKLRLHEIDLRRRNNGSGEFNDFARRQQGEKDQVTHEKRVKHLQNELINSQREYQLRSDMDRVANQASLHELASEASTMLDKKTNQTNAEKLAIVARERERSQREAQNLEQQNRLDRSAYETLLTTEKKNANTRVSRLKENFNTSMATLEQKSREAMENITKTSNQDKADFMKKVEERRSDEMFEMKRAFNRMMDATVLDYEQRIENYRRDNEKLKEEMGLKIAILMDKTEKQMDTQTRIFEDRREADIRSQQNLMDERENQLKQKFTELNINYQKKIDKMQMENDTKFKLMANDYESRLKELKAVTSRELAQKENFHISEMQRVKSAYEDEKIRLINGYEGQIESLKNGNEEKIRQMADFKKLT
jgi:hypothetical protein